METVDLDRLDEVVRRAMDEPPLSAEEQIERRMDYVLREMDEFMAMAANPETVDLIDHNRVLMGQIMTRAQLIGAFLMARNTKPGLRVVQNNG